MIDDLEFELVRTAGGTEQNYCNYSLRFVVPTSAKSGQMWGTERLGIQKLLGMIGI